MHETGWSWNEILWKVTRLNMHLMIADKPGHIRAKDVIKKVSGRELAGRMNKVSGT